MSVARPRAALVRQAVLDLRRTPDHRGELTNQLLLGEAVRVLAKPARDGWWAVEGLEDGYRGWARDWGLLPVSAAALARWRRAARHRIAFPLASLTATRAGGAALGPLPWMARVRLLSHRGGRVRVELPDGSEGWLAADAVRPAGVARRATHERVREFEGVPYLWGGRTALGLDCSGLTQLLEAERGVDLPRDSHEQWLAGRRLLVRESPRPGDLVFFSRTARGRVGHVGVYLGSGLYAHARGVVRLNSLEPTNPLFDKRLAAQFRGFTRPGKWGRRRAGKGVSG